MKKAKKLLATMCAVLLTAANLTAIPSSAMANLSTEQCLLLNQRMIEIEKNPYTLETDTFKCKTSSIIELENDLIDFDEGHYFMVSGLLCEYDTQPDLVTNICMVQIKKDILNGGHGGRSILYDTPEGLDLSTVKIGDIYRVKEEGGFGIEVVPAQESFNSVEFIGAGEDLFGAEFRKVIRHEFLSLKDDVTADDPETSTFDFVTGDLVEDDEVDIMDAIALNKYLLGSNSLTCYQALTADVDKNTVLDSTDSLMILKEVVGITTDFVET